MAARSTITVNDRETTPVAHAFAPRGVDAGGAHLFIEPASVPAGDKRITILVRPSGTNKKVRIRMAIPVLVTEVINGVNRPKTDRTSYVDATFTFAETSSDQERKNTVGMFHNMLAASQAMVNASVTGLEDIWG